MNGNSVTPARQQAKRVGNAGRVLPALPLTMTRPKQAKALLSRPAPSDRSPLASKEHVNGATRHDQTANGEANGHVDARGLEAGIRDKSVHVETPKAKAVVDVKARLSSIASSEHGVDRHGPTVQAPTAHSLDTQTKSTISPVSTRKLAERLDTRGVKTELPPAFVPHQLTPLNPLSTHTDQRPADAASQQHQQRPRAPPAFERDSSPSNHTPQSAELPAFAPPGLPFMPPHHHHSHHFSEPHVSWQNSAPSHSPMHWAPRGPNNASQPHFEPNGFGHHRRPSRDAGLHTNGVPALPAQRARAETQVRPVDLQSPIHLDHNANRSRMAYSDSRLAFEAAGRTSHMPPMPVMPFSPHGPPDSPYADPIGSDALRTHILRMFDSSQNGCSFADCTLVIHQGREVVRVPAHRLILTRSPTLFTLITNDSPTALEFPRVTVELSRHTRYLTIGLLQDGIRYLYGGPLPSPPPLFLHIPPPERMAKALTYVALGSFLAIDAIAHRAMQAVLSLLHWQTVAAALAFALDGGLSSNSWDDGIADPVTSASDSSSEDLPPFVRPENAATLSSSSSPTYDPFATDLLHHIVNFAVHAIPLDFYIDPAAPEFSEAPRLPTFSSSDSDNDERKSPLFSPFSSSSPTTSSSPPPSTTQQHQIPASAAQPVAHHHHKQHARAKSSSAAVVNPRLSQIRFGEILPPSTTIAEDHTNQSPSLPPPQQQQQQQHRSNESLITSLLLSLPFPVLKYLLEHPALGHRLGPETVASVSRQVVAVREERREKALLRFSSQAESASSEGKMQPPPVVVAPAVLFWRESVEPSTASAMGCRVVRWRVGREVLHTPPSELAES